MLKFLRQNLLSGEKLNLLLVAAFSAAVMLPVLINGLPRGYDMPHHFQCAFTFAEAIAAGDLYPSWSLERNLGYGGTEVRLYPPISHYTLGLFFLATQNWHLATWLTLTFFSILGGAGVYLWARELMPARNAAFAGCIYAFLPYHLTQIYNTFFYAEFVGSAVLPFSLAFVARLLRRRGKYLDVCGLAAAYALLVLTHLPLTVIGSLSLAIYAVALLRRGEIGAQMSKLSSAVFLGLAASSFFWVKVLQERYLLAKTGNYADPWLDYRLHFLVTPIQTFVGEVALDIYERSTMFYDLMLLSAVVLAVACTVPFWLRTKRKLPEMRGVWAVFAAALFLTAPASRFVWDALPFLQEVQFPWRWLAIVSLAASVLAGSRINLLPEWWRSRNVRPAAMIVTGCILAVVTFSTAQIIRNAPFLPAAEINPWIAKTHETEGFTFWWTQWTRREIFQNQEKVAVGVRHVQIQNWTATEREFLISPGEPISVRAAVFYYPNWQTTVNNVPVETKPDENGALTFAVPAEVSSVRISFQESAQVRAAQWISGGVWLVLLLSIFLLLRRSADSSNRLEKIWEASWNFLFARLEKIYHAPKNQSAWLLLLVVSVATILPAAFLGIFNGGDLPHHVQVAATFQDAFRSGNFFPNWSASENFGYGGLAVRFYPPLVPSLLAAGHIVWGSWHWSFLTFFLIFSFLGGWAVYLWAKEILSEQQAIWAGIFFILMPYHLFGIHNSAMYGEFAGSSVICFSFLYATRICRSGKWSSVLGLAISYAVLVLTHLPLVVIGSLSLLIYALILLPVERRFSALGKLAVAVALGLSASCFYWVKVVFERDWLRMARFWKDSNFDYNANFLFVPTNFSHRILIFVNIVLFFLVLSGALALAGLYFKSELKSKRALLAVAWLTAISLLMTTPLSKPLWDIFPALQETQFPWRWLAIASAGAAIMLAAAIEPLCSLAQNSLSPKRAIRNWASLVLLTFASVHLLIIFVYLSDYLPVSKSETFVAEKINALGDECFWTTQTRPEAFAVRQKIAAGERRATIHNWQPTERSFVVAAGDEGAARVASFYYPHWRASVNDQPVELKIAADGALSLALPADESTVKIQFQEPPYIRFGMWVSPLAWLVLLIGTSFVFLSKPKPASTAPARLQSAA